MESNLRHFSPSRWEVGRESTWNNHYYTHDRKNKDNKDKDSRHPGLISPLKEMGNSQGNSPSKHNTVCHIERCIHHIYLPIDKALSQGRQAYKQYLVARSGTGRGSIDRSHQ